MNKHNVHPKQTKQSTSNSKIMSAAELRRLLEKIKRTAPGDSEICNVLLRMLQGEMLETYKNPLADSSKTIWCCKKPTEDLRDRIAGIQREFAEAILTLFVDGAVVFYIDQRDSQHRVIWQGIRRGGQPS